ncbi:3-hydroxyacyl-[acyl-carrier-protein] dehydratase, FabZ form [hydrothermal vent metagenome]|uniref:3-hydroxyacyl-[acyl-carrier-protein] dehydratase, FabZ form n=1 Tax=hydrothermal vent metagenome TaxID=652676 RepID=A0A3B0ZKW9_9ZZZZ
MGHFIFVDRVIEVEPGRLVRGIKNISINEQVFLTHFPDHPIYPGNLIVEALAQLSGFLLELSTNQNGSEVKRAVLVQVEKASFRQPARVGDQLLLECVFDSNIGDAATINTTAKVEGELIAKSRLTFSLQSSVSESVHQQQRALYKLWTQKLTLNFPIL